MLRVAIASENDTYDGAVFERILSILLSTTVERWRTQMRMNGHRAVLGLAEPFLRRAADAGLRHALFVIDNDGGRRVGPEHDDTHDRAVQATDEDGCRTCRVLASLPPWWSADARHFAAAVPVQLLETWLLCIRGHVFDTEPEYWAHRRAVKAAFFGKPLPPERERTRLALEQVEAPHALERLRQRRSFSVFENQIQRWAVNPDVLLVGP